MGLFSKKEYDGEHDFPLWKKGGVCDVCGKSITGKNAYIIPVKEFYASDKYREYYLKSGVEKALSNPVLTRLNATPQQIALSVLESLSNLSKSDTSPAAVCKDCVEMFE